MATMNMMTMPSLDLSSVHDEKTVFNKMNHPTYVADLQKVSKFVPVSSYASLSTMAGSVKEADFDAMSLAGTQMSAIRERKNSLTESETSENSAATGNSAKKSERAAEAEAEAAAPLSPRSALQQKQLGEYKLQVQKRTELVAKLGQGEEYKIGKLVRLEKELGSRLDTIQAYDYWAHADYDADATALNRSTSAVNQMQKQLVGAADVSTDDGSSDTDNSMPLLENEVATDFWATHDYDEDFGAHNKSSADLHKEHEEQMLLRGLSAINNKVVEVEVVELGTPSSGASKGLRRIPSSQDVAVKMQLVDMALAHNRDAFFVDTSFESYDVSKDDFWASHDYDEDFGMHNNHAATLKKDHDATLNVLAQEDGYKATTAAYTKFYAAKSDVEKVRAHETWAYFRVTKDELADAEDMNSWAHMDYDDDFGMHCMVSGHN